MNWQTDKCIASVANGWATSPRVAPCGKEQKSKGLAWSAFNDTRYRQPVLINSSGLSRDCPNCRHSTAHARPHIYIYINQICCRLVLLFIHTLNRWALEKRRIQFVNAKKNKQKPITNLMHLTEKLADKCHRRRSWRTRWRNQIAPDGAQWKAFALKQRQPPGNVSIQPYKKHTFVAVVVNPVDERRLLAASSSSSSKD